MPKTFESRGTESVLNALILTSYDVHEGTLDPDARLALDNMWAQQIITGADRGAWPWLSLTTRRGRAIRSFTEHCGDRDRKGAGRLSLAPAILAGLELLRDYFAHEQESQVLINRVALLWASCMLPEFSCRRSNSDHRRGAGEAAAGRRLHSFRFCWRWKRADSTALETRSDGYATGLVALALEASGVARDQPQLKRALDWLVRSAGRRRALARMVAEQGAGPVNGHRPVHERRGHGLCGHGPETQQVEEHPRDHSSGGEGSPDPVARAGTRARRCRSRGRDRHRAGPPVRCRAARAAGDHHLDPHAGTTAGSDRCRARARRDRRRIPDPAQRASRRRPASISGCRPRSSTSRS